MHGSCAIYSHNIGSPARYYHGAQDAGFSCISRKRAWHIGILKEWGHFVREPEQIYTDLCQALKDQTFPATNAFWVDEKAVLEADMKSVKKSKTKNQTLTLCPVIIQF